MKKLAILICLLSVGFVSNAQSKKTSSLYNAKLAKKLGADQYGMKMYILVMLKSGTNISETKTKTDSLFAGHMANIGKMVKMGKLVVAGPMENNNKDYRGIFILNLNSIDEATKLLENDPAIKAKLLEPELYNWYGSAALSEYLPFHNKIQKGHF